MLGVETELFNWFGAQRVFFCAIGTMVTGVKYCGNWQEVDFFFLYVYVF